MSTERPASGRWTDYAVTQEQATRALTYVETLVFGAPVGAAPQLDLITGSMLALKWVLGTEHHSPFMGTTRPMPTRADVLAELDNITTATPQELETLRYIGAGAADALAWMLAGSEAARAWWETPERYGIAPPHSAAS